MPHALALNLGESLRGMTIVARFLQYNWLENRPVEQTDHDNFLHWSTYHETYFDWYKEAQPLGCDGQYVLVGCFKGTATTNGKPSISNDGGITWQNTPAILTGSFFNQCILDPRLITMEKNDILKGKFNGICGQTIVICTVSTAGVCQVVAEGIHKMSI